MTLAQKQTLRDVNPAHLHPAFLVKHNALVSALAAEGLPFRLFEGNRLRERQAWLYASGRTRPGPIVTKAPAGSSYHQYGLAGDYVLYINGKWSWDVSRQNMEKWRRLQELGVKLDLEPLSFELPHLQLGGLRIQDLRAGRLPT
jgi:peptidoglycan LD-endopeptidase CwlK